MRLHDCNWMQVERYLERDDRIVLPLGSTEQHAQLSLGTDAILAERVSLEAAEPLEVLVAPAIKSDKPSSTLNSAEKRVSTPKISAAPIAISPKATR